MSPFPGGYLTQEEADALAATTSPRRPGGAEAMREAAATPMPKPTLKDGWFYRNRRGDPLGPMDERVPGTFLDQYGTVYAANGQQLNHTHDSTGNIDLLSASTSERT